MIVRALLLVLTLLACACGGKKGNAIAEVTKAEGPIEREAAGASGTWTGAKVGTQYFLGDAARTADKSAELKIVGSGALILMQPTTILRFGGKGGSRNISVEMGAIDLTGTGAYALDIGEVTLSKQGTVRITAGAGGKNIVELTLGAASVQTIGGGTIDLVVGQAVEIGMEMDLTGGAIDAGVGSGAPIVDAGVPDAPPAVIDAATSVVATITGKKAEVQLPGETGFKPAEGTVSLPPGAKLKLGAGTSANVVRGATTLELAGGSRIAVGPELAISLETGGGKVTASAEGTVDLPGGAITLKGSPQGTAEARLDAAAETKVTVTRGGARLTGEGNSVLDMNRGESATLKKNGVIRVIDAIPSYFDFRLAVGDTATIHDPKGATAVQFQFGGKCAQGGVVELDKDNRFRTAKISSGKENANLMVEGGSWAYRLRCTSGGSEGNAVASGRIAVKRDAGSRKLPPPQKPIPIDADGRTWRVSYQSVVPSLIIGMKGTGSAFKLTLAQGGKAETFEASKGSVTVKGDSLKEGTYTYWFVVDGVKQPKSSTLIIDFDQTAPQVYIESPGNGKPWTTPIEVKGAVMLGWSAAVEGITLPLDKQRRFKAAVDAPPGQALAIRLSHPDRGVHYYLRRQKK